MMSFVDLHVCSDQFLLQFPTRYLEWIMIAREHSIDPTTSLDFNARADGLTEDERKEILSVSASPGGIQEFLMPGWEEGEYVLDLIHKTQTFSLYSLNDLENISWQVK